MGSSGLKAVEELEGTRKEEKGGYESCGEIGKLAKSALLLLVRLLLLLALPLLLGKKRRWQRLCCQAGNAVEKRDGERNKTKEKS